MTCESEPKTRFYDSKTSGAMSVSDTMCWMHPRSCTQLLQPLLSQFSLLLLIFPPCQIAGIRTSPWNTGAIQKRFNRLFSSWKTFICSVQNISRKLVPFDEDNSQVQDGICSQNHSHKNSQQLRDSVTSPDFFCLKVRHLFLAIQLSSTVSNSDQTPCFYMVKIT